MPVVRRGDVNRIDVVAGQELAKIVVRAAVAVLIFFINPRFRPVANFLGLYVAYVAHGNVLHIAAAKERPLVAAPHVSDAEYGAATAALALFKNSLRVGLRWLPIDISFWG
jgi:hypothetical protein